MQHGGPSARASCAGRWADCWRPGWLLTTSEVDPAFVAAGDGLDAIDEDLFGAGGDVGGERRREGAVPDEVVAAHLHAVLSAKWTTIGVVEEEGGGGTERGELEFVSATRMLIAADEGDEAGSSRRAWEWTQQPTGPREGRRH